MPTSASCAGLAIWPTWNGGCGAWSVAVPNDSARFIPMSDDRIAERRMPLFSLDRQSADGLTKLGR
jgi:hypothetical protein